jgi:hypothetical protein
MIPSSQSVIKEIVNLVGGGRGEAVASGKAVDPKKKRVARVNFMLSICIKDQISNEESEAGERVASIGVLANLRLVNSFVTDPG